MEKYIFSSSIIIMTSLWALWSNRGSLLFHPHKDVSMTPRHIGVEYKEFNLKTNSSTINGWFMKSPTAKKLIIFSHGNAGNISHRLHIIDFWDTHLKDKYSLLFYDYPGFGLSKGKEDAPSVSSCKDSLHAVIKYYMKEYEVKDICLYGESIGAAITAVVASELLQYKFDKVILQSSFTSIADMAAKMGVVVSLAAQFLPEELDVSAACKLMHGKGVNLIIMHSRTDEIVPFVMYEKLKIYARKTLILEGSHNETVYDEEVARVILE